VKKFPIYFLVIEGATQLLTMDEAIVTYNQDLPVEIEGRVVEKDGSTRKITDAEDHMIRWGRTG